jgi:N-acetylglucosaminyldiphosphoundecaprenol N-acetyl-beta-D-mannosaminyltransferase
LTIFYVFNKLYGIMYSGPCPRHKRRKWMRKTIDILDVPVDSITMEEAVAKVGAFIEEGGAHSIYTPNAEIMMAAQRDPGLKDILTRADMLTADGAGVVLASKILRRSVPEKVSGVDLVRKILKAYAGRGLRCFLFGSKPGVAEEAAERIRTDYPGVVIAGCRDGYFTDSQEIEIVQEINEADADLLLVALGAPKQEKWIARYKDVLNTRVCMGVGGTLDILSGKAQLAPDFFRRNGLEWLYRLYKEPKRAIRMLDLPRFMLHVLWAGITGQ